MSEIIIRKNRETLLRDLEEILQDKSMGFVKEIKIGEALFPHGIPPVIQLILLDPKDKMIAFRGRSNPDAAFQKTDQWQLGHPADLIQYEEEWFAHMVKTKASTEQEQIQVQEKQ